MRSVAAKYVGAPTSRGVRALNVVSLFVWGRNVRKKRGPLYLQYKGPAPGGPSFVCKGRVGSLPIIVVLRCSSYR